VTFRQLTSNLRSVLRVQVGIDLVEEVERRGIAFLDRKDCFQSAHANFKGPLLFNSPVASATKDF
jgi:hypothetical protein